MPAGPHIITSFVHGTLEAIADADAELGHSVREGLRPESAEWLGSASRISLTPVEIDVEVTELLFRIAGRERACSILRNALASTLSSPLFGTFLQSALRLRGPDPGRLFGWCSKVWNQIYRNAGDMRFVPVGDCEGRIEMDRLPLVMRNAVYLEGTAATVSALFTILAIDGAAELGELDAAAGHASITVAWEPRD